MRGFAVAKAASRYAVAPRIRNKMGAAIFSKSNLLSLGYNSYRCTHPDSANTRLFARNLHSEHSALLKIRHYDNQNLVIYVYRETADGKPASSKPCDNCIFLLKLAGIRRARYFDNQGNMAEMIL
jgi:deoxycytidylate deaminase